MIRARHSALFRWVDVGGDRATQWFSAVDDPAPSLGPMDDLRAALQACSDAAIVQVAMQPVATYASEPSSGDYPTVRDRLRLRFRSVAGGQVFVDVPGPKGALWLPGNGGLNWEDPRLPALVDAARLAVVDSNGYAIDELVAAFRLKE